MADKKISELPAWTQVSRGNLSGDEPVPIVFVNETITVKLSELAAFGVRPLKNMTADFTFQDAMRMNWLRCNSASPIKATIPTSTVCPYLVYTGVQGDIGKVTFEGVVGVTINAPVGYNLRTRARGAAFTLVQIAPTVWDLFGDLEPA